MTNYTEIHKLTAALHYEGPDNAGKPVIIDAAMIGPECFEIMAIRPDGEELASECAGTLAEAAAAYQRMLTVYTAPRRPKPENSAAPLTGKYAKLRDDLREALLAGAAAEQADPEDGGSCNFDACAVHLPRCTESKVKQAAAEAGTRCFKWNFYGGSEYVFIPNSRAQANARSRNAEAMTRAMKSLGWDALDYCQMD